MGDLSDIRTDTDSMRSLVNSAKQSCGIWWPGPYDGGKRNTENARQLLLGAAMLCGERDAALALIAKLQRVLAETLSEIETQESAYVIRKYTVSDIREVLGLTPDEAINLEEWHQQEQRRQATVSQNPERAPTR